MQSQPLAIVAPAGMRLDKLQSGGFKRQLDYMLDDIKPNFRAELGAKLQARSSLDLAGLVIIVVTDEQKDINARQARQSLYRTYFDVKRDRLLLLSDPADGTHCERSHGIPDARCTHLGGLPVAADIKSAFKKHQPVLIRIAEEMRRSGFSQLPENDELKHMGEVEAANTLKSHLESAGAADSAQGKIWLDQLHPDLFHFTDLLREQFPKKVGEWFSKLRDLHKVDSASWVEAPRLVVDAMRNTLFKHMPVLILNGKEES